MSLDNLNINDPQFQQLIEIESKKQKFNVSNLLIIFCLKTAFLQTKNWKETVQDLQYTVSSKSLTLIR